MNFVSIRSVNLFRKNKGDIRKVSLYNGNVLPVRSILSIILHVYSFKLCKGCQINN